VEIHQVIFFTSLLLVCCYVAFRGGAPERIVAATMVLALASTLTFARFRVQGAYSAIEVGIALTDLTLFLVIATIAMFSTRFWPILMASMIGCGLFGHLTKPLGPDILPRAYYIAVALWTYPELLLLAVAAWRHQARLARYGVDYAWVWDLPQRYRNGWSIDELARPLPHN
jgi:hypothetical protein